MSKDDEINITTAYISMQKLLKRSLDAMGVYTHLRELCEDIKSFQTLTKDLTGNIVDNRVKLVAESKKTFASLFTDEDNEEF